jgi:hypothetical protein
MTKAGDFGRRRRIAPFFASLRKAASSARLPSARGISSAEKNSLYAVYKCTQIINRRLQHITLRSAVTSVAYFWGFRLASHPLNKSSTIPETFATSSGVAY